MEYFISLYLNIRACRDLAGKTPDSDWLILFMIAQIGSNSSIGAHP